MNYLYAIHGNDNLIKIGFTTDPDRRIKELQTGNPFPLKIIHLREVSGDVKTIEKIIHKSNNHRRVKGEWFKISTEQAIAEIDVALMHFDDVDDLHNKIKLFGVKY